MILKSAAKLTVFLLLSPWGLKPGSNNTVLLSMENITGSRLKDAFLNFNIPGLPWRGTQICLTASSVVGALIFLLHIYLAALGFSCSTQDLWSSAAGAIFSCCMWDLAPWTGIKLRPPALGVQGLSHWTSREVPRRNVSLEISWYQNQK